MAKSKQTPEKYTGPFMEVRRIGHCVNGKAHGFIEYGGKQTIVADPTRPLSCFLVPLIDDLAPIVRYESESQFKEDIRTVKAMLDRLGFEEPQDEVTHDER